MAREEENRMGGEEKYNSSWVVDVEKMLADDDPDSRRKEGERWEAQSIYLVPQWLKGTNTKAYQPELVSLGPFHHGDPNLLPMEEHKRRALVHLIKRSERRLQDFISAIDDVAEELQAAYGVDLDDKWRNDRRSFVDMMLTDGCFLLEMMSGPFPDYKRQDPVFGWHDRIGLFPLIRSDMLLIENQLPLLVLKKILGVLRPDSLEVEMDSTERNEEVSFEKKINLMVLGYLGRADEGRDFANTSLRRHPLELYHGTLTYNNGGAAHGVYSNGYKYGMMPSASRIHESGIKIRKSKMYKLLDIHFERGVLSMPEMRVDGGTKSLYLNLMVFERLHVGIGHLVTAYVFFMNDMIASAQDVMTLNASGVLHNMLGSDLEVAMLFEGTLTRGQILHEGLHKVRYDVNAYCRKWWPTIKRTYFKHPWASVSASAGAIAFIATLLQTVFTVMPNKS